MKRQFLLLASLVALTSTVQAASVLQNFNDIADVALNNNLPLRDLDTPGGVGFASNYEQANTGVPVIRTNDLEVTLVNYVSGQAASSQRWSVMAVTNSSGAARRTQTRSTPAMSGTVWFSFLASLRSTNGDVALTFNGGFSTGSTANGQASAGSAGLRVGLGSYNTAGVRGALGVGPLTLATGSSESWGLSIINNGVNGAVTPSGFVPTDGTPVLILGRIDTDPGSSAPRVSIWYNPDVPNEASLPAPTLTYTDASATFVPTTVTRIGYQVVRSTAMGVHNELIDNVKVSDEPTGFDIVYKNAPLPTPVVTATGTVLIGSETGPTNLIFAFSTDKRVTAPLTIQYKLSGVATNGYDGAGTFVDADYTDANFDVGSLLGSVTIPAGQSNATVSIVVVDDALPEGNESVILTVQSSADYIVGSGNVLTGSILDNNDASVSLQYMFTRTLVPQVWDANLTAAPANTPGLGSSYSGVYFISPDAAFSAGGDNTAADAATSIANGDYMGLVIAPVAGRSLTLTNLQFQAMYGNYLNQVPEAASATVFVRSSLDNFANNLAEFVLLPDTIVFPAWQSIDLPLGPEFSSLPGQVEVRLYIYDDSSHNQVGVRIDNLYLNGGTDVLPPALSQVSVSTNVVAAAEPATAGQFTLTREGNTSNPLTVNYTLTGTATNGSDYALLPGTASFGAGQSTATVTIAPIDDNVTEATKTVTLTLNAGAGYGVIPTVSATLNILDDADIGGLVAWFFNESNNGAGSLASVAAASIKLTNELSGLNAHAGPGLGTFGAFNNGSSTHGYATSISRSAPSTFYIGNGTLSTDAAGALAGGDYVSFSLGAKPGYSVTLTSLSAWLKLAPGEGRTNWVFLRSSLDNFASDLGAYTIPGVTNGSPDPFLQWTIPLAIMNYPGAIEFRIYAYSGTSATADVFRLDDVIFQGSVGTAPAGSQLVAIVASDATASEPGSDTGLFTMSRSGDTTSALTVEYSLSGTASNGLDYVLLPGTAQFGSGQNTAVVSIVPINDNRPEPTKTATLTLVPSVNYYLGLNSAATVSIEDDGDSTPVFTMVTDTNAYERVSALAGSFTVSCILGDTNSVRSLDFTLGGSAVSGVDYLSSITNSLAFGPGVTTQVVRIVPLDNAVLDNIRTVTISIQTPPSYIFDTPMIGTVTIVDDEVAPGAVLWSDDFDAGTSSANYTVQSGSYLGTDDYVADFAFDYSTIGLPPAPGSSTTVGLMLNANTLGAAAGVNFYPVGQSFSGDFALRFNLYVSRDGAASSDNEAAYFGINQSGLTLNWLGAVGGATQSYTNIGEAIWATVATQDGTPGIATLLAVTNASAAPARVGSSGNIPDLFNSPPYGQAGRPNNSYDSTNKTWVDCEMSQLGGIVSLKLNNTTILQYTNNSPAVSGNIFIGYGDPFGTLGSVNCFAIFDNVRVVRLFAPLAQPYITAINVVGGTVEIAFTAGSDDEASAFKLQSSGLLSDSFGDDNSATLTKVSSGQFKATTTPAGSARFYRVRR